MTVAKDSNIDVALKNLEKMLSEFEFSFFLLSHFLCGAFVELLVESAQLSRSSKERKRSEHTGGNDVILGTHPQLLLLSPPCSLLFFDFKNIYIDIYTRNPIR